MKIVLQTKYGQHNLMHYLFKLWNLSYFLEDNIYMNPVSSKHGQYQFVRTITIKFLDSALIH